jgi:hypothetical protein
MSIRIESHRLLPIVLYLIALHSLLTGVGLILQPDFLLQWGGWGDVAQTFFPAQGGVFHILMGLLYALAARRERDRIVLLPYIIIVKFSAAAFLLLYFAFVEAIWLVLASGAGDAAMAVLLLLLKTPGSKPVTHA